MTPAPLKETFDNALRAARGSDDAKRFLPVLEGMREAMKELEDSGFRVSFEVRPVSVGFSQAVQPAPYANGTMTVDGLALDFTLSKHSNYSEYTILQTYMGGAQFRSQWYTSPDTAKETTISILLEAKARAEILSEFNMGQGVSRSAPPKPKLSA